MGERGRIVRSAVSRGGCGDGRRGHRSASATSRPAPAIGLRRRPALGPDRLRSNSHGDPVLRTRTVAVSKCLALVAALLPHPAEAQAPEVRVLHAALAEVQSSGFVPQGPMGLSTERIGVITRADLGMQDPDLPEGVRRQLAQRLDVTVGPRADLVRCVPGESGIRECNLAEGLASVISFDLVSGTSAARTIQVGVSVPSRHAGLPAVATDFYEVGLIRDGGSWTVDGIRHTGSVSGASAGGSDVRGPVHWVRRVRRDPESPLTPQADSSTFRGCPSIGPARERAGARGPHREDNIVSAERTEWS